MLRSFLWCFLVLLVACGKNNSSQSPAATQPPTRQTPPIEVDPVGVDPKDIVKIADLLPTMYYVPQEKTVGCSGSYGGNSYNGSEKTSVLNLKGVSIAVVCTRFYRFLLMEGTAILKNRGAGEIAVNYGGKVNGQNRYHVLGRCILGEGVRRDLCLLPYHTIAADNKVHKIGDIIYVPKAEGLRLPDGSIHNGYFIVRDTGGAFNGVGDQRVDLFTGLDPDYDNVFSRAGFHHKKPMQAFKITGDSATHIKQLLQDKFGDLY